jgi:hypothetical protein
MPKNTTTIIACILVVLGIFIPAWFVSLLGLILLSVAFPFAGVGVGFFLDILYGSSPFLPLIVNYPWMLCALLVGLISFFLRGYIRT